MSEQVGIVESEAPIHEAAVETPVETEPPRPTTDDEEAALMRAAAKQELEPSMREKNIELLEDHYGDQWFIYSSYSGTISTIIEVCPAIKSLLNHPNGFSMITTMFDSFRAEKPKEEEVTDDETKDELATNMDDSKEKNKDATKEDSTPSKEAAKEKTTSKREPVKEVKTETTPPKVEAAPKAEAAAESRAEVTTSEAKVEVPTGTTAPVAIESSGKDEKVSSNEAPSQQSDASSIVEETQSNADHPEETVQSEAAAPETVTQESSAALETATKAAETAPAEEQTLPSEELDLSSIERAQAHPEELPPQELDLEPTLVETSPLPTELEETPHDLFEQVLENEQVEGEGEKEEETSEKAEDLAELLADDHTEQEATAESEAEDTIEDTAIVIPHSVIVDQWRELGEQEAPIEVALTDIVERIQEFSADSTIETTPPNVPDSEDTTPEQAVSFATFEVRTVLFRVTQARQAAERLQAATTKEECALYVQELTREVTALLELLGYTDPAQAIETFLSNYPVRSLHELLEYLETSLRQAIERELQTFQSNTPQNHTSLLAQLAMRVVQLFSPQYEAA